MTEKVYNTPAFQFDDGEGGVATAMFSAELFQGQWSVMQVDLNEHGIPWNTTPTFACDSREDAIKVADAGYRAAIGGAA